MGAGAEHWAKVAALDAMGRAGDPAATPELLAVLDGEKECWHTKSSAIRALTALGVAEAGPAILKTLARDKDPDTREAAIIALGELRYMNAARLLNRIAGEGTHLAEPARQALARLKP